MNPWIPHLLRAGGGGGPVLPPTGRTMLANLTSSLILDEGTGDPTWSRATKAWGFNELGYLEELASGCAFFGGARLVRNLVPKSETFTTGWSVGRASMPVDGKLLDSVDAGTHRMYFTAAIPGPGAYMAWFEVKAAEWSKCAVGIHTNTESGGARVLFNLSTGTGEFHAGLIDGSFASTMLTDGWVKVIVRGNLPSTSIGVFLYTANDSGITNYTGDGTKGILVRKSGVYDVTNYDASYVPEYVSVGVEASPFFGAGIDGAKYFETDWQGAPIPAANLLGFRREAAATNNLLWSRDFPSGLNTAKWVPSASGAEQLSSGTVGLLGTATAATYNTGSGVGTVTRVDGSNQSYVAFSYNAIDVVKIAITNTGALDLYLRPTGFGTAVITIPVGQSVTGYVTGYANYYITTNTGTGTFTVTSVKNTDLRIAKTATGLDGIANTATTLTATAADAIILQPITLASAARCASAYVKRRTGTGTISFTQDGGGSWTDITAQINSSTWSRVQITATLANPSVGFKISTSGDAIDVDCVQNEDGAVATSPIVTTTAVVTRNADSLTYQTAGNIDAALGTLFCEYSVYEETVATPRVIIGLSTSAATVNALLLHTTGVATSSLSSGDGTTLFAKTGLGSAVNTKRKAAVSWGTGRSLTAGGLAPQAGAFSGTLPSTAIAPGAYTNGTFQLNGYIGPVAIYNYQMTDAELQALTT